MTTVKIIKKNDLIVKVEASGHACFAEHGKDIVCAAVSALCQGTLLGLKKVLKINPEVVVDRKKSIISFDLLNLNNIEIDNAQILLKTLELSLKDILIGNEKYLLLKQIKI